MSEQQTAPRLGCTKADIVVMILLISASMMIGGLLNQLREDRLPLRYQTHIEQIDEIARQINADIEPKLPTDNEHNILRLTLPEFAEFVESCRGLVVDARPEIFYERGHVPGALSLSRINFKEAYVLLKSKLEVNRSGQIVVYCAGYACHDSEIVCTALAKLGYNNIMIFSGGWSEWTEAGLPEETSQ